MPRPRKLLPSVSHRTSADALARLKWEGRRPSKPRPSPADVVAIEEERLLWRVVDGGGGMCHRVARALDHRFGWPMVSDGTYTTPEGDIICGGGHCWNVLPDGSILDGTADQWCEGDSVRILEPGTPGFLRYRAGFRDDFNPGIPSARWPELATCQWSGVSDPVADLGNEASRGHGWWSADPDAVRAKLEGYCFLYAAHARSQAIPCASVPSGSLAEINRLALEIGGLTRGITAPWEFGDADVEVRGGLVGDGIAAVRALATAWDFADRNGGFDPSSAGVDVARAAMRAYGKWVRGNPVTAPVVSQAAAMAPTPW